MCYFFSRKSGTYLEHKKKSHQLAQRPALGTVFLTEPPKQACHHPWSESLLTLCSIVLPFPDLAEPTHPVMWPSDSLSCFCIKQRCAHHQSLPLQQPITAHTWLTGNPSPFPSPSSSFPEPLWTLFGPFPSKKDHTASISTWDARSYCFRPFTHQ